MLRFAATYLATGLSFAAIDFVWLSTLSARLYRPTLDPVLAEDVNLSAAIAFYLVYVAGLVVLGVAPAARAGGWRRGLAQGAMLGAFAYATYDLTNMATLKAWALQITLADIAWGTFVSACACAVGVLTWRRVGGARG